MTSTTNSLVPAGGFSESNLIKTDVMGRMKRTREQRDQILNEYERSGLSGPKFAALCGVKYQTFAFWLQSRKRQRNGSPQKPQSKPVAKAQWIEAQVQGAAPPGNEKLVLHLPGSVRVEISRSEHIHLAAALVRALEKPC